ncbi:helix-turn-helix domain-containing protein [Humitalea sp. 24SJ18S-53]|uniref:helix-turn-helix domain-containing protein n=1 Tax=Humitalea sp. 24SJ18S-53 TaxID=3422307 RepID=UPI003D66CE31
MQQLAEGSGVEKTTLAKWFGGHTSPRANNLQPVADFLGVSMDWLLVGDAMKTARNVEEQTDTGPPPPLDAVDERLITAIYENVERIYQEVGIPLDRPRLVAVVFRQYQSICAVADATERRHSGASLVAMVGRRLRRELASHAEAKAGGGE